MLVDQLRAHIFPVGAPPPAATESLQRQTRGGAGVPFPPKQAATKLTVAAETTAWKRARKARKIVESFKIDDGIQKAREKEKPKRDERVPPKMMVVGHHSAPPQPSHDTVARAMTDRGLTYTKCYFLNIQRRWRDGKSDIRWRLLATRVNEAQKVQVVERRPVEQSYMDLR